VQLIFSIIFNMLIMVIPVVYMGIKNLFLLNIIWIVIWGFALQPFILLYKIMDINKGSSQQ